MSGKRVRKNPEKEGDSSRSPYTFRENILTAMQVPGDLACKDPIILTCKGKVILQGENLEIASYSPMEMEIKGFISCVLLERG